MREIKFRGKHKDILGQECEWIYGSYLNPRDSCAAHFIADREIPGLTEVIPITVGQYTGLKDENGVEIYEGDVLYDGKSDGVVIYRSDFARYVVASRLLTKGLATYMARGTEVIGNIFDDPNLKKKYWEIYQK